MKYKVLQSGRGGGNGGNNINQNNNELGFLKQNDASGSAETMIGANSAAAAAAVVPGSLKYSGGLGQSVGLGLGGTSNNNNKSNIEQAKNDKIQQGG